MRIIDVLRTASPMRRTSPRRLWMSRAASMVLLASACTSTDDAATNGSGRDAGSERTATSQATTEGAATSVPSSSTTPVTETSVSDTTPPVSPGQQRLVDALALAFSVDLIELVPRPDPGCLVAAVDELSTGARHALKTISGEPFALETVADDDAHTLAQAYVGCAHDDALGTPLALATGVRDVECVTRAWRGKLDRELIAASFAYGSGLDELPATLVEQLVNDVVGCESDRSWWIDEIALDLDDATDWTTEQTGCAATAYVETLGVERALHLQLLTLPLLTLPPADQQRLDLFGRCGIAVAPTTRRLSAVPGDCLTGFGQGSENTDVVDCAAVHNAEVIGVHDLDERYDEWPGVVVVRDQAIALCQRDVQHVVGDAAGYLPAHDFPRRFAWEAGDRLVTCVVARVEFASWEGPSGLSVDPAATGAPVSETLAVGEQVFDMDALVAGQCLHGERLLDFSGDDSGLVTVADCVAVHHAEVFHTFDLVGDPGSPYPSIEREADPVCSEAFSGYVGVDYSVSRLEYVYYFPTEEAWRPPNNRRRIVCLLYDPERSTMTQSMADTRE